MHISKSTYYHCTAPDERFVKRYEWVKNTIKQIIKDNPQYGIRRIHKELQANGITVGRDQIGELLKLWGLELSRGIRKPKISMLKSILFKLSGMANLLVRTKITRPFQAVSSDITQIRYHNGQRIGYVCFHKDVYGQLVYGWSVSSNIDTALVMASFAKAIAEIQKYNIQISTILFHQDQGSQYTSYRYVQSVLTYAKISYSKPGTPTDNAGQESAIGKFKDECTDAIIECIDIDQVERVVDDWVTYYNMKRLHTSIGYQTPFAFTKSCL